MSLGVQRGGAAPAAVSGSAPLPAGGMWGSGGPGPPRYPVPQAPSQEAHFYASFSPGSPSGLPMTVKRN